MRQSPCPAFGYNAWRCVEAGPVPVARGRRKSSHRASARRDPLRVRPKRLARACVVPHTGLSSPELTRPGSGIGAERSSSRTCLDTERGTEACLTGCREAVIIIVARFRAPADHPCKRGDREPCMVKPRGETARVNAEVCVMRRCCMNPTRDMNLTNPNPLQPFSNSPSDSSLFPNHAFPYCAQTGNQLIPARPAFGGPFFTDAAVPRKGGAGNGETI